jgi:hypothetical protein
MANLSTYRPQTLSLTGNITGANLVAGTGGTGTVHAGNIIVNGQPTTPSPQMEIESYIHG